VSDSPLMNELKASLALVRRMQELEDIALDYSLPRSVRVQAAYWSIAVRQELSEGQER
jgi:hypothetical protein